MGGCGLGRVGLERCWGLGVGEEGRGRGLDFGCGHLHRRWVLADTSMVYEQVFQFKFPLPSLTLKSSSPIWISLLVCTARRGKFILDAGLEVGGKVKGRTWAPTRASSLYTGTVPSSSAIAKKSLRSRYMNFRSASNKSCLLKQTEYLVVISAKNHPLGNYVSTASVPRPFISYIVLDTDSCPSSPSLVQLYFPSLISNISRFPPDSFLQPISGTLVPDDRLCGYIASYQFSQVDIVICETAP